MRKILIAIAATVLIGTALTMFFEREIGQFVFSQIAAQRIGAAETVSRDQDGLHLALCGTGSPFPSRDRAGPCNVVIAGDRIFIVDIGEGGARNINLMGIDIAKTEALLLTHFHSDHVDGIGPLALLRWTQGSAVAPLPVFGPPGLENVVDGFNAAYLTDKGYRIAHHGAAIVPPSGAGLTARPFAIAAAPIVVLDDGGLRITAFPVDHDPVTPAVGYRFDYNGRSVVISGDTARSTALERAAQKADILVHDALQPVLVGALTEALDAAGNANTAIITRDILDYHASPEDAAASAQSAGVRHLVLSHLVPPTPARFFYPAFLGDAGSMFSGTITVGEDGMLFSLPANSDRIESKSLL